MLSLAIWIRGNGGDVFEIRLYLLERFARLQGLVRLLGWIEDEAELAQDFPDSARRSRRDHTLSLQVSIAFEIVEDGTRSRRARAAFSGGVVRISMIRCTRRTSGGGGGV